MTNCYLAYDKMTLLLGTQCTSTGSGELIAIDISRALQLVYCLLYSGCVGLIPLPVPALCVLCSLLSVLSGSSDTSLKFWNLSSGICSATLRTHNDYVRALAYGEQGNVAMSAGLDSQVFFWDIPTLLCVSVKQPTVNSKSGCCLGPIRKEAISPYPLARGYPIQLCTHHGTNFCVYPRIPYSLIEAHSFCGCNPCLHRKCARVGGCVFILSSASSERHRRSMSRHRHPTQYRLLAEVLITD